MEWECQRRIHDLLCFSLPCYFISNHQITLNHTLLKFSPDVLYILASSISESRTEELIHP